jgi:superoxide dismutase, Cu-Zn family
MSNASSAGALLLTAAVAVSACGRPGSSGSAESEGESRREAPRITAQLEPTRGNQASGAAIFLSESAGVTLQLSLQNAPPGVHAVHLHETGDCSAHDASSAGGHWNPTAAEHGRWGKPPFHLGDIGNVEVGQDGTGSLNLTSDLWTIGTAADNDILGKAVIVHAKPDDFETQPTGAAGDRIACGVIRE